MTKVANKEKAERRSIESSNYAILESIITITESNTNHHLSFFTKHSSQALFLCSKILFSTSIQRCFYSSGVVTVERNSFNIMKFPCNLRFEFPVISSEGEGPLFIFIFFKMNFMSIRRSHLSCIFLFQSKATILSIYSLIDTCVNNLYF